MDELPSELTLELMYKLDFESLKKMCILNTKHLELCKKHKDIIYKKYAKNKTQKDLIKEIELKNIYNVEALIKGGIKVNKQIIESLIDYKYPERIILLLINEHDISFNLQGFIILLIKNKYSEELIELLLTSPVIDINNTIIELLINNKYSEKLINNWIKDPNIMIDDRILELLIQNKYSKKIIRYVIDILQVLSIQIVELLLNNQYPDDLVQYANMKTNPSYVNSYFDAYNNSLQSLETTSIDDFLDFL